MEQEKSGVTPEQMKTLMDARTASLKEQIAFLKVELEFNQLQADIMEAQARYIKAEVFIAHVKAGPPEERPQAKDPQAKEPAPKADTGEKKEPVFRTLKTEPNANK